MRLVAGASTQSRARRPLPPGAVAGETLRTWKAMEEVRYVYENGRPPITRHMLSWVLGQNGCLWGGGPWPNPIDDAITWPAMHGAYGHRAEHALTMALAEVYDPLLKYESSVRFFQDGGTACEAAARIARYVTGRWPIASYGYHGAGSAWAHKPGDGGVLPEDVETHIRLEFGDVAGLEAAASIAACIMLEVPAWDDDAAAAEYLARARDVCSRNGIPLIIDDVVLGFRLALGGSVQYYGVVPDMVVLGKAMSATGQISAVLGRGELVDTLADRVFYSTTFGGHPHACNIAAATVNWLRKNEAKVYGKSGHLRTIGQTLKHGLNARGIRCEGQPERSIAVFGSEDARRAWCGQMMERGIIVDRPFFPCLHHTPDHVAETLEAAR